MKSFLEYVAEDILNKYGSDLSRTAIVFPNKRASLFMNEYLARHSGRPLWSPTYMTISELFRNHSDRQVGDSIKLVCDLHRSFVECTGLEESLDHFYGWGLILLSDFDDIDKNMADADKVFANLRDIHELDDVSYLTEEQTAILKKFFSNFSSDHNTELKRRFLQLWSHFGEIYHHYNQRLADQQLTYEGALYRQVATNDSLEFPYDRYLFVGFNLLQKVEQQLFKRLRQQGKAKFYWDFDAYYMPTSPYQHKEAGYFIAQYLSDFPNELDQNDAQIYRQFEHPKTIRYISAPTNHLQAKYIAPWLENNHRISDGRKTAIVLCDESILQMAIHSLPDDVGKINITTGYPLFQSPVASLVSYLISLQTTGYHHQRQRYRLQAINKVLRHPYTQYLSDNQIALYQLLNTNKIYYPEQSQLTMNGEDEGLSLLFGMNPSNSETFNSHLLQWLMRIISFIATRSHQETQASSTTDDPLFQESLFRTYTLLNRLLTLIEAGDLMVDISTLQRLINQLFHTTSVPFHGEPAEGIQLMGVLETRNLDFDHLLVLSCYEGNIPKGINDTSFIPYNIRKVYGLTTADHKVAIYAYYFHRLLQRASDITLVYNNATTDGKTGEMSRFMLQLMVESPHQIEQRTLQAGQQTQTRQHIAIEKSAQVVDTLLTRFDIDHQVIESEQDKHRVLLTPTAINKYMRCPLQFFYRYVAGIVEPDNDEDDLIDNRIFGNIFHDAAQFIYKTLTQRSNTIMPADIQRMLESQVEIEQAVEKAFRIHLFKLRPSDTSILDYNGLQMINRKVIITYLRQLLEIDQRLAPFTIIGLEVDVVGKLQIQMGDHSFSTRIGGRIDRLDSIGADTSDERIRVIDYKTGSRRIRPLADVDAIFDPANIHNHSDYYLQTFLYSHLISVSPRFNPMQLPVSPALLFIQHTQGEDYDPTLLLGKEKILDIKDTKDLFRTRLLEKINEIFNPDIPFQPTDDSKICRTCPYAQLCGK